MLRSVFELIGYSMAAADGDLGKAHDFLFDDEQWTIRHLVVDTGHWLPGRKVLIAPEALGKADWAKRQFSVSLTREQIENSPPIDTDEPVSRQKERVLFEYFAWTPYWGGGVMWPYAQPGGMAVPEPKAREPENAEDTHLRSVRAVNGYHISAHDGDVGHVEDFVIDDESWVIRYIVADTRNWLPGKKVLLSPSWFKDVNWQEHKVSTDLNRDQIKDAPEFDPRAPVNRELEAQIYDFYGRPKYWE